MIIEQLSLKGFLRFRDPVSLDLRQLPAGLIAIVGANGAGKTTLLESVIACLYRTFPSRDREVADYASGRDSFLEVSFAVEGRGSYRARLNVDGVKRVSDGVLHQGASDGLAVLNDGRVSTFDQVIAREFPSKDLMLASSFAAQNKRGDFISQKPKDRKELFAELLGLGAYETMAQTAKTAASIATAARDRLDAVRSELARETTPEQLEQLLARIDELNLVSADAAAREQQAYAAIADIEQRLAMAADVVAAYASATRLLESLQAQSVSRATKARALLASITQAGSDVTAELSRIEAATAKQLKEVDEKIKANRDLIANGGDVRAAVSAIADAENVLVGLREDHQREQSTIDTLEASHRELEQRRWTAAQQKTVLDIVERDARTLATVPCAGEGVFATCQFLADAKQAEQRIPELRESARDLDMLESEVAALAARVVSTRSRRADAWKAIQQHEQIIATHKAAAALSDKLAAADARIEELTKQRAGAISSGDERRAEAQARATARLEEMRVQVELLDGEERGLRRQIEQATADRDQNTEGNARAIALGAELQTHRKAQHDEAVADANAKASIRDLQNRYQEFVARRSRLTALDARRVELTSDILEWELLEKALGPQGLPNLEIDAAGPTISALLNDILAVCFGTRFSVELVTQVARTSGKGFKDEFTVQVTDNDRGGEVRDIGDLSGGEKVIVSEALMNAIAIYVNTRSAMPIRTAWRDETTGALDTENALRYIEMLRKVHVLGGLHHTFFITHNPDVAGMADAQIHVADGGVSIALPPFTSAV